MNNKGFTLVESIVALLLLSLLAVTLITALGVLNETVTRGREIQAAVDEAFSKLESTEAPAAPAEVTFTLLGRQVVVSGTTYQIRDAQFDFVQMEAFYPFEIFHEDPPPLTDYIPLTDVPVNSKWPGKGGNLTVGETFHEGANYYVTVGDINNINQDLDHFVGNNKKILQINYQLTPIKYYYKLYHDTGFLAQEDLSIGDIVYIDKENFRGMVPGYYVYLGPKPVIYNGNTISMTDGRGNLIWEQFFIKLNPLVS